VKHILEEAVYRWWASNIGEQVRPTEETFPVNGQNSTALKIQTPLPIANLR